MRFEFVGISLSFSGDGPTGASPCKKALDTLGGLARRFELLRESKGEEGLRVFRHLEEALDWVLAENAAA
jgi:hypothetical protein